MTIRQRPRSPKGQGERLADEILDAAETLLVRKGSVDAVSVREIARQVGVSPPSIYLHFADKEALFFECCRRGFTSLVSRMEAARSEGATAVEQLRRMGRAYVDYGLEKGSQYRVIFGSGPPAAADTDDMPGVRAFEMLVETVSAGVESGEIRPDLDPLAMAVAIWSAVHGAVLILLTKAETEDHMPLPGPDDVVDAVLRIVEQGFVRQGGRAAG